MRGIEIKADKLLYWYSKLTGTKGRAKMGAFFPFIFRQKSTYYEIFDDAFRATRAKKK